MIIAKTKRKIIITKFEVSKLERFKAFQIRLPANVKKLSAILVTASGGKASGTISFQTNDMMDVFMIAPVFENGIEPSDESLFNVEDPQFDSDKAWVTGNVPVMRAVNVEGDTTIINAWFKGEGFDKAFVVRVYVACELAEELVRVVAEEKEQQSKEEKIAAALLEPNEIHL